jgi:hypothetical protein
MSSASELNKALADARPGEEIMLTPGTYEGGQKGVMASFGQPQLVPVHPLPA